MKKTKLALNVNFKVINRVNSEKNPLLYEFVKSIGFKMPPEILVYLLLVGFQCLIIMGLLAENIKINNLGRLNVLYSSGILILVLIIVEVLIVSKKISINSLLFEIIPLTKKEFIFIKIYCYFISLRLWCFFVFILFYGVFSYSYGLKLFDQLFFVNLLFFLDVFIFVSAIIFFYSNKINFIPISINRKIIPALRLFSILIIFFSIKKLAAISIEKISYFPFQDIIANNIILITFLSFSVFTLIVYLCAYQKR